MSRTNGRRLDSLESKMGATRSAVYYTISLPNGWAPEKALAAVGLEPGENDLVILVKTFSEGTPELRIGKRLDGGRAIRYERQGT